ncbi:MAG: copper amine oxidase N-terminal domain-containing protein, partial [Firmicutes bacterium]|nr:copper amine oxidase N-terminal domain-containing protein [Bacillota bacterium]
MVCLALLFFLATAAQASTQVIVDGKSLSFDTQPVVENGRMLVPLRSIFEALNAKVNWDNNSQTITATKDDTNIKLIIGGQAYKNDQAVTLDVPAKLVSGRTLVPLRFVSEALGAHVNWENGVVTITSADAPAITSTANSTASTDYNGQSAYQLYIKAKKDFHNAQSLSVEQNINIDLNLDGMKFPISIRYIIKQVNLSPNNIQMTTERTMQWLGENEKAKTYYKDGYYYLDRPPQKIKMAISPEEFSVKTPALGKPLKKGRLPPCPRKQIFKPSLLKE